jgi:hypothetical protein
VVDSLVYFLFKLFIFESAHFIWFGGWERSVQQEEGSFYGRNGL